MDQHRGTGLQARARGWAGEAEEKDSGAAQRAQGKMAFVKRAHCGLRRFRLFWMQSPEAAALMGSQGSGLWGAGHNACRSGWVNESGRYLPASSHAREMESWGLRRHAEI